MESYDLGTIGFTYNSSLKLFLLSFIITDLNGSPFIFECKFRINNLDTMHDTMVTNLYSIGGAKLTEDVESRFMKSITDNSKCYPNESITKSIFESV